MSGLSEGSLVLVFVLVIWPVPVIMTCGWRDHGQLPSLGGATGCRFRAAQALGDWEAGDVVFVADDLTAWLVGLLADAGRRKLSALILGTDQERALRSAATAALWSTAAGLRPDDEREAELIALVISEIFDPSAVAPSFTVQGTLLEALQAGIAERMSLLDDCGLTGTGQSSAELLGTSGGEMAGTFAGHLVREILVRGANGGPLAPLAAQLNHDVTHLQGHRIETLLGQLDGDVRRALPGGEAGWQVTTAAGPDGNERLPRNGHPLLDPPYQPVPAGAPEAWLLQPRFGVVPYVGREGLLGDLEAWCAEGRPFSIGVVAGEGGSGKSRLAAELCRVMSARGWEAGLLTRAETLADVTAGPPVLLVVDYPEQRLAGLGPVLEQLASRPAGPQVRVLLLAREPSTRSHWWADLDRTSHRTMTGFTTLRRDLTEHTLSLTERREHAEAAAGAFSRHLGAESTGITPDLADDEFANPLLVHIAALLAVHGQRSGADSAGPVREEVLAHLLDREQSRWERLKAVHGLGDLHETHAVRAVVAAVLTSPSSGEVTDMLEALPEFSGPTQQERRGRIGYWLADLYPGEPLLASFGPDLLSEQLLGTAAAGTAGLAEVITAVHLHGATSALHRSRMLAALQLAAERRPAVHAALRGYLAAYLPPLVQQALDDSGGHLAAALDSALVFCGERTDPGLKLAFACVDLQAVVPQYHEHGAQLLHTTMTLAMPPFRGMAEIDPAEGLDVLVVGLTLLVHRCLQAGRIEDALAVHLECIQVRRQLAGRDPERQLTELSFDLINIAATHMKLGQLQQGLAAAEEAVAIQRRLAQSNVVDETRLALALHRLTGILSTLNRYDEALTASAEALPVLRRLAGQDEGYYGPVLAEALAARSGILIGQHLPEEALAMTTEALRLRERLAEQWPEVGQPSMPYDLHNISQARAILGQYAEALADAERAVTVTRQLAAVNAPRHRAMLIRNLDHVARLYLQLARPGDAVAAAEEAVTTGRQGTEADLAQSLAQLIPVLITLKRCADALPACQEAAPMLHRLAESEPAWLGQLSNTTIDLSQVLEGLGQLDEALETAHEALGYARRLGRSERSTLARALVNLGDQYARLDRIPEALDHTREGAELLRPDGQPEEIVPALAKLADRHARLGQRSEALTAAADAVQMGEAAQRAAPISGHKDFAFALGVLGDIHLSFGRREDGLEPLTEAVRLYKELAAASPGQFDHELAAMLLRLANIQLATGRYDEAVTSGRQASRLFEQLASMDEDRYLGSLTFSLRKLRGYLVTAGQMEDALSVARQQVETAARLAARKPQFREILAQSYGELAKMLLLTGRSGEAQRMTVLSEIHHQVAQGHGMPDSNKRQHGDQR
jgi:tetratricopeptide (TPR) repeat protein